MSDNLALWDSVSQTDPEFTKKIEGKNYQGTSASPMYLVKKATEQFGPMGKNWGVESIEHETEKMGDTVIYSEHVRLWYMQGEQRCEVSQWSSIKSAYQAKNGKYFIDEDARKKCRTNATSKCLSLIGFSADIWMKEFDNPVYQEQMRTEHGKVKVAQENARVFRDLMLNLETRCACTTDEEKLLVCQWIMEDRELELGDLKINQATTNEIKAKLTEAIEQGFKPKRFLTTAKEWSEASQEGNDDATAK